MADPNLEVLRGYCWVRKPTQSTSMQLCKTLELGCYVYRFDCTAVTDRQTDRHVRRQTFVRRSILISCHSFGIIIAGVIMTSHFWV